MGGGGKGGSAPATPDFSGAAQQQAQSSQNVVNQQTQQNRPDQSNAFGANTSWSIGPDGQPMQTQSFGGPLGSAATGLESQIAAGAGTPLDTGTAARTQAINAAEQASQQILQPQQQQATQAEQAQLAAQGLDPGSQAYNNAMTLLNNNQTLQNQQAMEGAIGQGTAAQQATFGENLAAQQAPFSELGSLQGFTQMPQFAQAGQAQATQYLPALAAQYAGQLQNYGIQQQGKNSKMNGAASLGGTAALAASDERLKTNVHRLPYEALPGVPFAVWDWKDGRKERRFGVIAQDLQKVLPLLVHRGADGYLMVDYSSFGG